MRNYAHRRTGPAVVSGGAIWMGASIIDRGMSTPPVPGTRIGPYEIQSALGAGGMGEVYRARDTRLDRTVAIKILARDPRETAPVRERFAQEARALSQLNHPHVCTLYDVGEQAPASPDDDPLRYLVMEFVDGETLAARIERGALPLDQALSFAIQMADALDKVHRAGIIHGDLKPGNIMVTKAGIKLLDFGLARQLRRPPPSGWSDVATQTIALPATTGLVGTLQYLAPEQLEGRESDARSDIFACGAVIYEMVTGRKAFPGDSPAAVMANIMTQQPAPLSAVQPASPPALEHTVAACLAKDPAERWQHAGDLARELKWIATAAPTLPRDTARPRSLARWVAPLAALLLLGVVVALLVRGRNVASADAPTYRTSILLPEGLRFPGAGERGGIERFAISPDGRRLAFVATDANGNQMLWLRPLDSLAAASLPGTDGASSPFWSPDSRRVAFFSRGQLKIASFDDSSPVVVTSPAAGTSGAWNTDDVIVFTPTAGSPLHRVSARGGASTPVTMLDTARDEIVHRNPVFLPDGKHFLYVAVTAREGSTTGARGLFVGSLDPADPVTQVLEQGSIAKYSQGHLLFVQDKRLIAQPFDPDRLALEGEARTIAEQVELIGPSSGAFSVSATGVLAYEASGPGSQLVWFSREGRQLGAVGEPGRYGDLELSPDGRQAIVSVLEPETNTRDLWMFDVERGVRTRFTFDAADEVAPIWAPDSASVVFTSNRKGHFDLYRKAASGIGPETLLLGDDSEKYPTSWLPNGSALLYWTFDAEGTRISQASLAGEEAPKVVFDTPVQQGRLSPDGRWLAYSSAQSGRAEVYVVPFPVASDRWQVSSAGGTLPRWSSDGREILFAGRDNRLMAVAVKPAGDDLDVDAPRPLFDARPVTPRSFYAIAGDGRILVNALQGDSRLSSITVVQNWVGTSAP